MVFVSIKPIIFGQKHNSISRFRSICYVNMIKNFIENCRGSHSPNKAFKTDSQRSAFLVCFSLSVYGTMLYVQWSALLTT
ncbi:hypothetical protein DMJ19_24050 [Vibrio parahaemolyticus]|nr:hypothetical protein [Vibrio parahaemolyticus]EGR3456613.1 hypothetical protein [Vibrio parahaemolyticus]